jgi:hypothetical protein
LTTDEDALAQQANLSYYLRVHRRILLGVLVNGADMRRINQSREFSNVRGQFLGMWFAPHGFRVDLQGGYGAFQYRHFEAFNEAHLEDFSDGERYSSHGDNYNVTVRKRFSREFRMWTSYQLSRQFFAVLRSRASDGTCAASVIQPRTDVQHQASIGFRVLYHVLIDASYQLEVNNAGSCGESFVGHRVLVRFAARPFWKLFVNAEVRLQFRAFTDGAPFDPSFPFQQDDNLTTFTLRISRPVLPHMKINIRYSHFANLLGLGINQYSRNLFTIGMTLLF